MSADDVRVKSGFPWVGQALNTPDTDSPRLLGGTIQPVLQLDGWGHSEARTAPISWTVAPATAAATYDLLTGVDAAGGSAPPADPEQQAYILMLSVVNRGGIAVMDGVLQLRAGVGPIVQHSVVTIPHDMDFYGESEEAAAATSDEWMPWGPLWVPPGFRAQLRLMRAQDGNGTLTVTGLGTTMPAGLATR